MKQPDLRHWVDQLVRQTAHEQNLPLASLSEATQYRQQTITRIWQSLRDGRQALKEGLHLLQGEDVSMAHPVVADIARKLEKNLGSSKRIGKIIQADIVLREASMQLFASAFELFHDQGDLQRELQVLSVLLMLFPANAQVHVFLGSYLWRAESKEAAEQFYEKMTAVLHDPAFDYFAADCMIKNDHREAARAVLDNALRNPKIADAAYRDVRNRIARLLVSC